MRFLQVEFPSKSQPKLNKWLKFYEKNSFLKCIHIPIIVNHTGHITAIYFLNKEAYDSLDGFTEWEKIDDSYIALDHNLACLKIIKALYVGKYNYWTARQNQELIKKNRYKDLNKLLTKRFKESKSVDFIYDRGQGRIAAECELTMKSSSRYLYSKGKKLSVIKKINRDFGRGMFKKLEYWVPMDLKDRMERILANKTRGADVLTCPYEIKAIEQLIPGWKRDDRYKFILSKMKNV